MPRLPIDETFDVDFVNELARREMYNKHLYRPNSYLHKWWARRCGTTFRAILKHLVSDPAQRDFYTPKGLEGKLILDPMMGGGTTLHEAIRLGANVIGADIDPIPVLQARATLTETNIAQLRTDFEQFHAQLSTELGEQYQTQCNQCTKQVPFRFVLYGQRRHCACGHPVILVDSLTLRAFKDGSRIHINPLTHAVAHGAEILHAGVRHRPKLVERKHKRCPDCGQKYKEQRQLPWNSRLEPYAIFAKCRTHGEFFKPFDAADCERLMRVERNRGEWFDSAEFQIEAAPKSQSLLSRGINSYLELFSARQLNLLYTAAQQLQTYSEVTQLNLALLLSTSLEFNSLLCGYKGWHKRRPGTIKQTFVRHAYSLPYTVLENNPIFGHKRSGTLHKLFHSRIVLGRQWAQQPQERNGTGWRSLDERDSGHEVATFANLNGHGQQFLLRQGSSADLDLPDNSVDFVITDPPYYDSVQYGDLARFFTIWLRQLLPDAAQWAYSLADSAINQHDKGDQFETTLAQIFIQCRRVLKPNGRLIFTFHHWKPEAWAALTYALRSAEFHLVNHYIVQAENPKSIHIQNQIALQHDVILVCAQDPPTQATPAQATTENDASSTFSDACANHLRHTLSQKFDLHQTRESWLAFTKQYFFNTNHPYSIKFRQ
ncbi:MAG: DNA methyltransferase [Candidatus Promineifilaceae bacterium]